MARGSGAFRSGRIWTVAALGKERMAGEGAKGVRAGGSDRRKGAAGRWSTGEGGADGRWRGGQSSDVTRGGARTTGRRGSGGSDRCAGRRSAADTFGDGRDRGGAARRRSLGSAGLARTETKLGRGGRSGGASRVDARRPRLADGGSRPGTVIGRPAEVEASVLRMGVEGELANGFCGKDVQGFRWRGFGKWVAVGMNGR